MFNLERINYEAFVTIPNAFAPHECDLIRGLIENNEKEESTVGHGMVPRTNKSIRDSRLKWLHAVEPEYLWIFERVATLVKQSNYHFNLDLTLTESVQLTEYDSEYQGFYGAHTDASYEVEGTARYRKISLTMQLSDPSEYEGGELALYWQNIQNPYLACKDKGTMTLFRSHIIHEVLPVTKGKRYSFVSWVQGPLTK